MHCEDHCIINKVVRKLVRAGMGDLSHCAESRPWATSKETECERVFGLLPGFLPSWLRSQFESHERQAQRAQDACMRWYNAYNARDCDANDGIVAPEYFDHAPHRPARNIRGPERMKQSLRDVLEAFRTPDSSSSLTLRGGLRGHALECHWDARRKVVVGPGCNRGGSGIDGD
jgi:hypothetical protein